MSPRVHPLYTPRTDADGGQTELDHSGTEDCLKSRLGEFQVLELYYATAVLSPLRLMLRALEKATVSCVVVRAFHAAGQNRFFWLKTAIMRTFFWLFSIFWAAVAFCQLTAKGLSVHAGAYPFGYLGIRFTEEIIWAEALLLIAVGYVVHSDAKAKGELALSVGVLGCFLLLGLHVMTYRWDSGYVYRSELAGDLYKVPWRYHPSGSHAYRPSEKSPYETIGIWVVYPGFTPLEDGRSQSQVRVWFQKTPEGSPERPNGAFRKPRRVDVPECVSSGNWVHCRFHADGFWYDYRHPSTSHKDTKVDVPLDEVMETLPSLLDSFKAT